jgi:hypothetical protein
MKGKGRKKAIDEQDVKQALLKKAIGYDTKEVVEEFAQTEEGEVKLTKRKVTTKSVPPDITALKILMDENAVKPISQMTDEELEQEKTRLLNLLENSQNK